MPTLPLTIPSVPFTAGPNLLPLPFIASTATLFTPTTKFGIQTLPFIASTAEVFELSVLRQQLRTLGFIASGSVLRTMTLTNSYKAPNLVSKSPTHKQMAKQHSASWKP